LFAEGGGIFKRALKTPFLAIYAKGGESIIPKQKDRTTTSPKQKDRTTMPISKIFETSLSFKCCFQIGIFEISIPQKKYLSYDIYILRRSFLNLVSKIFDPLSI
jgi:hypothetical protein